jgi:hypothetical protein
MCLRFLRVSCQRYSLSFLWSLLSRTSIRAHPERPTYSPRSFPGIPFPSRCDKLPMVVERALAQTRIPQRCRGLRPLAAIKTPFSRRFHNSF